MTCSKNSHILLESQLAWILRAFSVFIFSALFTTRVIFVFWGALGEFIQLLVCLLVFILFRFVLLRDELFRSRAGNLCLLLSSLYSISFFVEPTRNIIWALFAVFLVYIYNDAARLKHQPLCSNLAFFISFLFAMAIFVGYQLVTFGRLEIMYFLSWEELRLYKLFLYAFKFLGLFGVFYTILYRIFYNLLENPPAFVKSRHYKLRACAAVPLLTAIFLACWLPYFIAFYPGIYHPDSIGELDTVLGYGQLINHHPFFHLMFIKFCLDIGELFGSVYAGLAIYSALQMIIQAAVFAAVLVYLAEKRLSPWLLYPLGLFFGVYMVNGLYSIYMVKDVLFACCCIVTLVMLTEESLCNCCGKKRGTGSLLALIVVLFLFCISRNNGIYAFIIGFILYAICNRERIKRYAVIFSAVILLFSGYNYLVFDVLGVAKGRSAEMLSMPLQQIARTFNLYPSELESPEAQVLREVFPDIEHLGDLYKSYISDPVKEKGVFDSEIFDENPLRYAKAWAGLGLRHVRTYIDAMLLQCYGYFYPSLDVGGTIELAVPPNRYDIQRNDNTDHMRSRIANTYGNYSSNSPTAILHSIGFSVWLIIIGVGIFIVTGRGKLAAPCFILLGKWMTILLSPVFCEFRYVYCLVLCAPIVLVMALGLEYKPEIVKTESTL